jgi:hypothetical protein
MLRVDPRLRSRLIDIIHNLNDRIAEAKTNSWLGEVEGLQISLDAAKTKLKGLDRMTRAERPRLTNLGMPVIRQSCDRCHIEGWCHPGSGDRRLGERGDEPLTGYRICKSITNGFLG